MGSPVDVTTEPVTLNPKGPPQGRQVPRPLGPQRRERGRHRVQALAGRRGAAPKTDDYRLVDPRAEEGKNTRRPSRRRRRGGPSSCGPGGCVKATVLAANRERARGSSGVLGGYLYSETPEGDAAADQSKLRRRRARPRPLVDQRADALVNFFKKRSLATLITWDWRSVTTPWQAASTPSSSLFRMLVGRRCGASRSSTTRPILTPSSSSPIARASSATDSQETHLAAATRPHRSHVPASDSIPFSVAPSSAGSIGGAVASGGAERGVLALHILDRPRRGLLAPCLRAKSVCSGSFGEFWRLPPVCANIIKLLAGFTGWYR